MTLGVFLDTLDSYNVVTINTTSNRKIQNGMNINVYDLEVVNVDYGKKGDVPKVTLDY